MARSKRQATVERLQSSYRHELAILRYNIFPLPIPANEGESRKQALLPGAVQRTWSAKFWCHSPAAAHPVITEFLEIAARHRHSSWRSYDETDLLTAVQTVAADRRVTVPDYLRSLADDADEFRLLVEAFVTPHSAFFRRGLGAEVDPFASLAARWLPGLARAHPERPLRVWSAGIGRGEEPYSLAILLAELETAGHGSGSVLGTDVSAAHIQAAQTGSYSVDPTLVRVSAKRQRWFSPDGPDQYRVVAELRSRVRFAHHDLLVDPFVGPAGEAPFDLVLCRHTLMFFTPESRRRVLAGLASQVVDGGLLVFDHCVPDLLPGLVLVDRQARIWRKA